MLSHLFIRKTVVFLGLGVLWLFLLSLPVGQGKNLYDVGYYYLVDTRPIHWLTSGTLRSAHTAKKMSQELANDIVGQINNRITK